MSHLIETILSRRSVRKYTGDRVRKEDLEMIVRAGMSAPTSRDTRHFVFVVVDDGVLVEKMAEALPYAKMLLTSRHAIVVASDLSLAHGGSSTDYWVQDCSAAAQNVLLAAHALGYAACWTAAHPRPERVEVVRALLSMPEQVVPLCVIAVGKSLGDEKPRDKFDSKKMYWNAYGRHL